MEKYYYLTPDNQQQGPVPAEQFRALGLTPSTYVWKEGMANWTHISDVPGLLDMLKPQEQQPATEAQSGTASYRKPQPAREWQQPNMPKPDSYLVLAILSTVFCCLPTGIYAIICSNRVDTYWVSGHYDEALKYSKRALIWSLVGICWIPIYVALIFVFGITGAGLSALFSV